MIISPEYSLEGLMLKLKCQSFGHLMRTDSLEKTLMLGKTEGKRRRGWQRMRWLDGITEFEQAPGNGEGQGSLACCSPWGCKESDTTEWLNWTNWTALVPREESSGFLRTYRLTWKCCTQYASKCGKLSSGHRTGNVSFHSNPKERQCQRMLKLLHNCTHLTC